MPVKRCQRDGKPGWKWGNEGHCYTYPKGNKSASDKAKQKAYLQGVAIGDVEAEEEFEDEFEEPIENFVHDWSESKKFKKIERD